MTAKRKLSKQCWEQYCWPWTNFLNCIYINKAPTYRDVKIDDVTVLQQTAAKKIWGQIKNNFFKLF